MEVEAAVETEDVQEVGGAAADKQDESAETEDVTEAAVDETPAAEETSVDEEVTAETEEAPAEEAPVEEATVEEATDEATECAPEVAVEEALEEKEEAVEEKESVEEEESAPVEEEEVNGEPEPTEAEEPTTNGDGHEEVIENGNSTASSHVEEEVEVIKKRLDKIEIDQGSLQDTVNDIKSKFEDGQVTSPTKKAYPSDVVGPSVPMKNLRAMFGN